MLTRSICTLFHPSSTYLVQTRRVGWSCTSCQKERNRIHSGKCYQSKERLTHRNTNNHSCTHSYLQLNIGTKCSLYFFIRISQRYQNIIQKFKWKTCFPQHPLMQLCHMYHLQQTYILARQIKNVQITISIYFCLQLVKNSNRNISSLSDS